VTVDDVVEVMMKMNVPIGEAIERVRLATWTEEVEGFLDSRFDDPPMVLTIDPITFLRLERRSWFWSHADEPNPLNPGHTPTPRPFRKSPKDGVSDGRAERHLE
jgi:hypothetical protein